MTFRVNSTLIRNPQRRIKLRKFHPGGREHYHVGVWIEGEDRDLDQVLSVQYKLHSSFKQPLRESSARGNNFSVTFWTWGMFGIQITLRKKDGSDEALDFHLKFELPDDDGSNYVDVGSV
jgi:transcription initiation factor IIF auxiliary subunit